MMAKGSRQRLGAIGEELACEALARRGYEIVARNWRCARGEIDLIARDGTCWVFVEVKTRRGRRTEPPEDALSNRRAQRLVELAEVYLGEHASADVSWRIELVAVELGPHDVVQRLRVVPGIGLV